MAKRVLDQFDMEAEREGNAIRGHTVIRRGWGKGHHEATQHAQA